MFCNFDKSVIYRIIDVEMNDISHVDDGEEPVRKKIKLDHFSVISACPRCKLSFPVDEDFQEHVLLCCGETPICSSNYASAVVGPKGGCISIEGTGISFTIPPGALDEPIKVSIRKVYSQSALAINGEIDIYNFPLLYRQPNNYLLLKPAITRVTVGDDILAYCRDHPTQDLWVEERTLCLASHEV
jgi:hypothetical protein